VTCQWELLHYKSLRIFDVKPYFALKPFTHLKNLTLFNEVYSAELFIEWITGQDICPDESI
jgi:hypothetical protein